MRAAFQASDDTPCCPPIPQRNRGLRALRPSKDALHLFRRELQGLARGHFRELQDVPLPLQCEDLRTRLKPRLQGLFQVLANVKLFLMRHGFYLK